VTTRIPRRAIRIWLQGLDRMPARLRAMCDTFDELHPDWTLDWYDDERIRDEVDLREGRDLYDNAPRYVPVDSVAQLRADIARYAILRQRGGVTLDVDYHWHRPVDDLLTDAAVVLAYEKTDLWIACGFMGARRGHTLFTKVLAGLPANAARFLGSGLRANVFTGPKYLTATVNRLGPREDIRLLPDQLLHGVPWNRWQQARTEPVHPDAYATHAWAHQRGLAGVDAGSWKTW
jgi:mannosyltransferase OCH1-like enzyme